MRFRNRADAGRQLVAQLADRDLDQPVVLALPRGGVPVAFEVAAGLRAPLDVFVARKVGAPGQPELGIGAVAEGGSMVIDRFAVRALGVTQADLDELLAAEQRELDRRVRQYRGGRDLPDLAGRDIVLVDDGLATGVTAEAALHALRRRDARTLLLAVPVCASPSAERLRAVADDVVCVTTPIDFHAVGLWYQDFGQTSDEEVAELLERAAEQPATR